MSEPEANGNGRRESAVGPRDGGTRHPKKSHGVLRSWTSVTSAWTASKKVHWPATLTCNLLGVGASDSFENGSRRRLDKPGDSGADGRMIDEALLVHICAIHAEARGKCRGPGTWKELVARGHRVGKERVRRFMQPHSIRARCKSEFIVTSESKRHLPIAPDMVQRNFTMTQLNQVGTGDTTYIATDEDWMYLAIIIALFTRQVVGWSMQPHMHSSLVTDALKMAWFRRYLGPGVNFHSDRGSQYCCHEFRGPPQGYKMECSMSCAGNCRDHGPTESPWVRLKVGRLYGQRLAARRQALDEVIDWLTFYNHRRLHTTVGYFCPTQFEQRWDEAQLLRAAQWNG